MKSLRLSQGTRPSTLSSTESCELDAGKSYIAVKEDNRPVLRGFRLDSPFVVHARETATDGILDYRILRKIYDNAAECTVNVDEGIALNDSVAQVEIDIPEMDSHLSTFKYLVGEADILLAEIEGNALDLTSFLVDSLDFSLMAFLPGFKEKKVHTYAYG